MSINIGGLFNALVVVSKELIGAELIDSLILRPFLIYICSSFMGLNVGIFIGSLVADASFWGIRFVTKMIIKTF